MKSPASYVTLSSLLAFLVLWLTLAPETARTKAATIVTCGGSTTKGESATEASTIERAENEKTDENVEILPQIPSTTENSDVQQFFKTVHCTLEKARPVVEQIEKEVHTLRTVAQRLGEDMFSRLGSFFDRLFVSPNRNRIGSHGESSTTSKPTAGLSNDEHEEKLSDSTSTSTSSSSSTSSTTSTTAKPSTEKSVEEAVTPVVVAAPVEPAEIEYNEV